MAVRRRNSRQWALVTAVVGAASLILTLVSACGGGSSVQPTPTKTGPGCPTSAILVPSCGVLWGVTTEQPTTASMTDAESLVGRQFDTVYRFHDLNSPIPNDSERQLVAQGKVLHISLDARDYQAPNTPVSYSDVANGRYDAGLIKDAQGIASLKAPVFVTFEHEANAPGKMISGTGADFQAAWRHVHDVFDKAGATNAVWVWVMLGGADSLPRAETMWPGNDVVDWISWDVYNASGCRAGKVTADKFDTFENEMTIFYNWVHSHGAAIGMDVTKPMMVSEAGSVLYSDDPSRTADWYLSIPTVLKKYPQIKSISLWNHTGSTGACDYRFKLSPVVVKAVTQAGQQAPVNAQIAIAR